MFPILVIAIGIAVLAPGGRLAVLKAALGALASAAIVLGFLKNFNLTTGLLVIVLAGVGFAYLGGLARTNLPRDEGMDINSVLSRRMVQLPGWAYPDYFHLLKYKEIFLQPPLSAVLIATPGALKTTRFQPGG
jgi:hypothetical protein